MKLDRETGLSLVGVPEYGYARALEAIKELEGYREKWRDVEAAMRVEQLRVSCGAEPKTIKFRRPVPYSVKSPT